MARKGYSPEEKAVVLAALMQGQSINSASREYKIPKSTISRWKNEPVPASDTQKSDIGELVLEYLRANLKALKAQTETFSDPRWLKTQGAQELAILHGVMTDKAVRLLEAMSKNE